MENVYKQQPGLFRLRAIAIWEWLMILPATLLLAAAALRMLQPRQYEPARTSWIIFEWTMTHVSRLVAAVPFHRDARSCGRSGLRRAPAKLA